MNKPRMSFPVLLAGCILLACATRSYENVSAEVLDDCQREVAILTDRDIVPAEDPTRRPSAESLPEPIDDARAAQEVAGGPALTDWPEEALMYRCFRSRGVELTTEQAEMLAEWQRDLESDDRIRR